MATERKHSNPIIQKQLEEMRELRRKIRAIDTKMELMGKHRGTSAARHAAEKSRLARRRKELAERIKEKEADVKYDGEFEQAVNAKKG